MARQPVSRRQLVAGLGAGAALLALSGCGSPPSTTFDLSAARDFKVRNRRPIRGQLIIYEPSALAIYDSDRIVVKSGSQGLTYLPGAQWADRLPRLVQTRMIQSFENANQFKSVGRPGDQITPTMVLNSDIRAFQIDAEEHVALVEISVKAISEGNGRIERANLFRATVPLGAIDVKSATSSLDEALRQTMQQIVAWGVT